MHQIRLLLLLLAALALPAAALSTKAAAQEEDPLTAVYELNDISEIDIEGPAIVDITIGEPELLTVIANPEDLDNIDVDIDEGELNIEYDDGFFGHHEPEDEIRYEIVVESLEDLELSGAVVAEVTGVTGEEFDVALSGASVADFTDIDVASLEARLSGASNAEFAGTVETQEIDVSGASTVQAGDLESTFATVEASGASTAVVRATEALQIEASGASVVDYVAPEVAIVTTDASGAAIIRALPYTLLPAATPRP